MDKLLTKRNTIILIGLITLWKIYMSAAIQLHPDEAYYWLWSRHLDLGYYDHSPMVAYFIKLTTLFSQSELWVRFSGAIVSVLLSIAAWVLSMQLFGSVMTAAASVIILNVMPLTMTGSILITPDIPASLFSALCIYYFWQIIRTQKTYYWHIFGICLGLSFLSKYTAVLIIPSLLLFLLLTDERRWLKTIYPYLSVFIGCLFFLPVVYWNSSHDWVSFKFQFGHGLEGQSYSLGRVVEYISGQMLVASPFIWLIGIFAGFAYLNRKNKEKFFLSITSWPLILFFAYTSLKKLAGPNWPATAYFTFALLIGKYFFDGYKIRRALIIFAAAFSFFISFLAMLHTRFSIVPLYKFSTEWERADATNFFYGWKELGEQLLKDPEIKFALTSSHQFSAEVAYYTKEKVYPYIDTKLTRISQFNYWGFDKKLKNSKGVYINVIGESAGPYMNYLGSVEKTGFLDVKRNNRPLRSYKLFYGKDYKL